MQSLRLAALILTLWTASTFAQDQETFSVDTIPGTAVIGWDLLHGSVLTTCLNCHAGKKNPNLDNYASVVANINDVWDIVQSGDMPPPKANLPALTSCQLAILKKWMDLGEPQTSAIPVNSLKECAAGSWTEY